jgi:hypothetical protein
VFQLLKEKAPRITPMRAAMVPTLEIKCDAGPREMDNFLGRPILMAVGLRVENVAVEPYRVVIWSTAVIANVLLDD